MLDVRLEAITETYLFGSCWNGTLLLVWQSYWKYVRFLGKHPHHSLAQTEMMICCWSPLADSEHQAHTGLHVMCCIIGLCFFEGKLDAESITPLLVRVLSGEVGTLRFTGEGSVTFQLAVDGQVHPFVERGRLNLYEKTENGPARLIMYNVSAGCRFCRIWQESHKHLEIWVECRKNSTLEINQIYYCADLHSFCWVVGWGRHSPGVVGGTQLPEEINTWTGRMPPPIPA